MIHFHAPSDCHVEYREIPIGEHRGKAHTMRALIVRPKDQKEKAPGVLWLHGGGYVSGFPEMAYFSRAIDLVVGAGAVIVCPNYRKALTNPYPAAIKDCYRALVYVKEHAEELNIDDTRICVGGESAGGGLTAALCMLAKDRGEVNIAFQMPLYPMLDNEDTPSSADNHEKIWDTPRNHAAWALYLRDLKGKEVPAYASPSRRRNYEGLPPCYTFVGDIEPFYYETLAFVDALNRAGVEAKCDVYHNWYHAYDVNRAETEISKQAAEKFVEEF
ncbi:MAG: alpha/beta hydrolase, partial [Firmicutes bacterium]|nr:alpha/beta hydrolase [Bacillota bacterium]